MPIPDFQSLMLPALKALSGGTEISLSTIRNRVADSERLSPEDLQELLPSGRQPVFANRVGWALLYLGRAGLSKKVRRGVWRLTTEGERLLADPPARISIKFLRENYPAYVAWRTGKSTTSARDEPTPVPPDDSLDTPEEVLDQAVRQLSDTLEAEVLSRVCEAPPSFLERVVVDLLIAMGYGGGDPAMGRVTGQSGDGGIDGTIREDALGLDEVYVQAKKYADGKTVGEGDLRNFAGAIDAAGTTKGVFVTTARFTDTARSYVARSPKRIGLIDGQELAHLMVTHDIGVRTKNSYEIKRIDEDYFDSDSVA